MDGAQLIPISRCRNLTRADHAPPAEPTCQREPYPFEFVEDITSDEDTAAVVSSSSPDSETSYDPESGLTDRSSVTPSPCSISSSSSPGQRSQGQISLGKKFPGQISPGQQFPGQISEGEQSPRHISSGEKPPGQISAKQRSPMQISPVEQSPKQISSEQLSPETSLWSPTPAKSRDLLGTSTARSVDLSTAVVGAARQKTLQSGSNYWEQTLAPDIKEEKWTKESKQIKINFPTQTLFPKLCRPITATVWPETDNSLRSSPGTCNHGYISGSATRDNEHCSRSVISDCEGRYGSGTPNNGGRRSVTPDKAPCSGTLTSNHGDRSGFVTPHSGYVAADVSRSSSDGERSGRRKKSRRPIKSARPEDPKFKGVTVQFRTRMYKNKVQFLITAYFNCRKLTRRRWRHGVLLSTSAPIFADARDPMLPRCAREMTSRETPAEGGLGPGCFCYTAGKQCASCGTRKTPLWRDAEDGTPLCNACGIRYKKYRVRCGHCWFVPKKESKANPVCTNCGEVLRYSFLRLRPALLS